ncbi:1-acyl-sn-glycerol-3-phosphate acyltransferase [Tenuifilum osseticum]|uniref:1-acyl-sn-glycerol-3-phosphate acyltransferase n=1 Tax=Tenuifilum osseticum TaxID=3374723 RepID=UPI0034E530B4
MPTNRERIEEWSKAYWLLRFYQNFLFKLYFKTEIVGMEKLPPNTTFIFAPNHQNALIDALAMLTLKHSWQPIFLARADIFKKPLVSKILTFLKIMPVYRIRDGFENLSLNDSIFLKTMDIIRKGNGLVILPEGNHAGFKMLRPLKKGIARIALQTEDASDGSLNIHIVPVGLDYSNYVRYRSKLLIRIGEPFPVKKYLDLYRQSKALAYNALIDELSERIKAEMIHIEDEQNYYEYLFLTQLFPKRFIKENKLPNTLNQAFEISKRLILKLDRLKETDRSTFDGIIQLAHELRDRISANRIKTQALPLKVSKAFNLLWMVPLFVALSPLAIFGFINHIIPIIIPYQLSKKFEDVQFHSSVRHAAGLLLLPLAYLIQTVIVGLILKSLAMALLYLVLLPPAAVILYNWRKLFYKIRGLISILIFATRNRNEFERINNHFNRLMNDIKSIF